MASLTAEKIALFRSFFRGREDVFPRRWENLTTARPAMRRPAATNGCVTCAGNRTSNAENARTRRLSQSQTMSSMPISRDKPPERRRISRLASIPCLPDETCCFWPPIRQGVLDGGCRRLPRHGKGQGVLWSVERLVPAMGARLDILC